MPKMKSRSNVKKRFKLTGTGKIKRKKGFARHILTKKARKRKRLLRKQTLVDSSREGKIRMMLSV